MIIFDIKILENVRSKWKRKKKKKEIRNKIFPSRLRSREIFFSLQVKFVNFPDCSTIPTKEISEKCDRKF